MAVDQEKQSETNVKLDVSLEDIGPARKCLTIDVPAERIAEKIESNYARLGSDAVVPGFRKGRAPRQLLEKRFGTSVMEDSRNQLLGECYKQAVEDQDLDVIGEPDIKDIDTIKLPDNGPLQFKVDVEISPKVELPDLTGIEVTQTPVEVTKDQIKTEVDRLQQRMGQIIKIVDAPIKKDDYVSAAVSIYAGEKPDTDAEPIIQQNDVWITVHGKDKDYKGHVVGIVVAELGKSLIGKKTGDTVNVSTTGPASHENEQIRDQPISIVIDTKSVERLEPASVDQILEKGGLESASQLEEQIAEQLKERNERQDKLAMHEQICEYLLDKIDLELPEGLTSRQSERMLQTQAMELAYSGLDHQQIEEKLAELRQNSQEQASRQLKRFFVLDQAAKSLEIDVSNSEVNGRIATMAIQQGRRPEKFRQEMERKGEIEHLFLQIREQKTLEKILESAKVNQSTPTAPDEGKSPAKKKVKKKSTSKKKS